MPSAPWDAPGWFEQASAWIREQISSQQLLLRGEITRPHTRPWSTVLRVPTQAGSLFFKATAPCLAYEARLTEALVSWCPDLLPDLLAADLKRSWLLMRASGAPIRESVRESGDLSHWAVVLPAYAELQIEFAGRQDELLSLGVFDRRLESLPYHYQRLLEDREALCLDQPDGLTQIQYQQLFNLIPNFKQMCARLSGYGLPATLHHDDFHDGNVFLQNGRYSIIDWGETCLAHPFFSMLVNLRSTAYSLKWEFNDPRLESLREAYLRPWERFAKPAELLDCFRLAMPVAMVNRALTWHLVVSALEGESREAYAESVPGWLMEFLDSESADSALL